MKWEYAIVVIPNTRSEITSRLNELGAEGWELVTVDTDNMRAYFKRPIPETCQGVIKCTT